MNLGGPNDGPNAAQVGWLYNGFIASGIGAPGSSVVFADINGDGQAEYLSIDANGAATCYLNLGPTIDDGPHAAVVGWLPPGVIATGVGAFPDNIFFAGKWALDYLYPTRSSDQSGIKTSMAMVEQTTWMYLTILSMNPEPSASG